MGLYLCARTTMQRWKKILHPQGPFNTHKKHNNVTMEKIIAPARTIQHPKKTHKDTNQIWVNSENSSANWRTLIRVDRDVVIFCSKKMSTSASNVGVFLLLNFNVQFSARLRPQLPKKHWNWGGVDQNCEKTPKLMHNFRIPRSNRINVQKMDINC